MQGALLLDAGPFGHSGESISLCAEAGLSAVCTETISLADGTSPWWNIYRQGNTLYNCSKWSDLPYRQWAEKEIPFAKQQGATVIATVGMHAADAEEIIPALDGSGADGIKVVSYYEEDMPELVKIAKRSTRLPVWAKLSSNWKDPVAVGRRCLELGADALVAMDTIGPVRFFSRRSLPRPESPGEQLLDVRRKHTRPCFGAGYTAYRGNRRAGDRRWRSNGRAGSQADGGVRGGRGRALFSGYRARIRLCFRNPCRAEQRIAYAAKFDPLARACPSRYRRFSLYRLRRMQQTLRIFGPSIIGRKNRNS